jgi:predicted nucleic acid-binding protein
MTTAAAWILDISVAAKWYLRDESLLDQADRVFAEFSNGTINLAAPAYFFDEAGNIFRTAVVRGRIAAEQARRDYASLLSVAITVAESTLDRRAAALDLALVYGIAFYDALYLQLAQESGLPLLTADESLYQRIAAPFPTTVYVGDLG